MLKVLLMFLTPFLILAAKLLFLLASIAMQNVAVCGIRNGRWKVRHSSLFWRGTFLVPKVINWVTIWQPNSFTNLPQFAFSPKLYFFILPRLAFISGRIALISQNRFAFTSFFRNFAIKDGELTPSRKKKQTNLFCSSLDFSYLCAQITAWVWK